MKKYLPIKIFSMHLGYGWWWGSHFFFFKRWAFAIMPIWLHLNNCTYQHGKAIKDGDMYSWSPERQREDQEDERRFLERNQNV